MGKDTVIVVGGGVIGIACAHYLNRSGMEVMVIEKDSMAAACSHGNCGYVCPSHVLPLTEPEAISVALKSLFRPNAPFRVKPRLSPALWRWMLEFARRCRHETMMSAGVALKAILDASMQEYHRLVEKDGLEAEWQEQGLLYVLKSDAGMEAFARTDALLRAGFQVGAQRIEGSDLPEFEPALRSDVAGAYFYPGDTHLRPDVLNRNWVKQLTSSGVQFREGCELQRVQRRKNQLIGLQTNQGELRANHFVFAMGAWSRNLGRALQCAIPIEPGKGYSVTMRRPKLAPKHPILFPEHKVGVTPFDEGYRLGSMMEFAGFDDRIPSKRIQQLRDSAKPYLLEPYSEGGLQETWFGWRPMTWDSLPIIGPVPRMKNAFLATGHNMLGLSLAPATGRLLTEMIVGETPHIDPDPFSPGRF